MSIDRVQLARYLAQLSDLGGELFLETLDADEARRLVALAAGTSPAASGAAPGRTAESNAARTAHAQDDRRAAEVHEAATEYADGSGKRAEAKRALAAIFEQDQPGDRAGAGTDAAPRASTAILPPADSPLRVLHDAAQTCTRCRLAESRTHVVFGEGPATARVVIVGEAPGQEEDRTGRPFVGRAGKLLDLLLLSAGFARDDVYICNVLKCRPPQNRNPLADEVEVCTTTWLKPQLDAIGPAVILAVGKFAAQLLATSEDSIGRLRGRVHAWGDVPLIASYHPAYLLRSPEMVRTAWQDFQLLRRVVDEQA